MHILRALGVDIADYDTPVDRATASLVYWYEMAEALGPETVFRVEDARNHVVRYLRRIDLTRFATLDASDLEATPGPGEPLLIATPSEADSRYNASSRRFGTKPALMPDHYLKIAPELLQRLELFCSRYSYAPPWEQTEAGR